MKLNQFVFCMALGSFYAVSTTVTATETKYAAVQKEQGIWKVVSVSDAIPQYQEGMEILALPEFRPAYDQKHTGNYNQSGRIDCPPGADKTVYTPCNSYFYRFGNANWFGLAGISVMWAPARYAEVKNAILANEEVAAIKAKADAAAAERAQAAREAAQLSDAKKIEAERVATEKRQVLMAGNIEKMSKVDRGMEDSCKRIMKTTAGPGGSWFIGTKDPDNAEIKFQFGGEVFLQGLANAGWLVINKNRDSDGIVTEYYIRKAR